MSNTDFLSTLDEVSRAKIERMFSSCEEVVGIDHVAKIVSGEESHSGDSQLKAYIGLEPSGKAHLGWMILAETMNKMLDEGVHITVLLADWHAWVNDKFSRDMEKISLAADYMSEVFRVLLGNPVEGSGPGEIKFIRASEMMESGKYWERVLKCSKNMSLSRVRRTFSIMGRDEDSSDHDLSAFFYPALQAADIFELEVDIALGGMDQRKAHMYMREVADRNKWVKATCIHTPMLSGLKGSSGRMDSYDHKMSKSDPNNAILLHDTPKKLEKKMRKAFLEIGNDNSAIYEIAKYVLFPRLGKLNVEPKPEFGQPSEWDDIDTFISAINKGIVHPFDAKMAVARGLGEVLAPVSKHFLEKTDLLDAMNSITGSQ
jgi:tyrosyl-tRNA synthetase